MLVKSLGLIEHCISLYNPQAHAVFALENTQDPGVGVLGYAGCLLQLLGYPDQAIRRSAKSLKLAQDLFHRFSLAFCHIYAVQLHQFQRSPLKVQEVAEAMIAQSKEHGFVPTLVWGMVWLGWALE